MLSGIGEKLAMLFMLVFSIVVLGVCLVFGVIMKFADKRFYRGRRPRIT